jgi:hypothetical protein
MNGQYSHVLDISINGAIRSDFNFNSLLDNLSLNKHDGYDLSWKFNEAELLTLFSQTWLDYMASLDLKVNSCVVFFKEAGYQPPGAHIDTYANFDSVPYVCNLILPPATGDMVWYQLPIESPEASEVPFTKTTYKAWLFEDVDLVELCRESIGNQLTLVRTDLPHHIANVTEDRWCLSMRFYRDSKPITDWDSAVEYFKPFIKE